MTSKIIQFFEIDIWQIRSKNLSIWKAFLLKQTRIIVLASRRFAENRCYLLASALTFYFLLSIIPVVAMALGIAKGFGYEKLLQKQILNQFSGSEEVTAQIIKFATSMLETVKGGAIAGVGAIALIWTFIKLLENIEISLNEIWEIKKTRPFIRKFSDYLSIMLLAPILIISSTGLTIMVTTSANYIIQKITILGYFTPVILFILNLFPYCLTWVLFAMIYILLPNTRVKVFSASLAGLLAGSTYQLLRWTYINFQIGVSNYNAIYGSFSAFPLFLIWTQLGWLIILFGAEISFAHQNVDKYELEPDIKQVSQNLQKLIAVEITRLIVKQFEFGKDPLNAIQISKILDIPNILVCRILDKLVAGKIILDISKDSLDLPIYNPSIDINKISVAYVLDLLDKIGQNEFLMIKSDEGLKNILKILQDFKNIIELSNANKLLKDI